MRLKRVAIRTRARFPSQRSHKSDRLLGVAALDTFREVTTERGNRVVGLTHFDADALTGLAIAPPDGGAERPTRPRAG